MQPGRPSWSLAGVFERSLQQHPGEPRQRAAARRAARLPGEAARRRPQPGAGEEVCSIPRSPRIPLMFHVQ